MNFSNLTSTFSADKHEETVAKMVESGEKADSAGQKDRRNHKFDPMVDIRGGKERVSRNIIIDGLLTKGIKLPVSDVSDGTASMGTELINRCFMSLSNFYKIIEPFLQKRYQLDFSSGLVQDVCDYDVSPVVQISQFEHGDLIARHMTYLQAANNGGDPPEDYDLLYIYLLYKVFADITNYGLKGYSFLTADQIGRGTISPNTVSRYLGFEIQFGITTEEVCQQLLKSWHLFYLQVSQSGYVSENFTTRWWKDVLGEGRVILVPNHDLLAEAKAGLIYVSETINPDLQGLTEFLLHGNQSLDKSDCKEIWNWLQPAKMHFGAQAKLPGFNNIPLPGAGPFSNSKVNRFYPDNWEGEILPPVVSNFPGCTNPSDKIDWEKV